MYLKKRQENFKSRTLEASKQLTSLEMTYSLLHKSLHIIEDFLPIFNTHPEENSLL